MEPCALGAKIRDGIYLTTSGISLCESPGIRESIKTGKGAAPPKKQIFGKAGCDPGAGKDLCGLGWNVQIFWEKRDFLIYDLWDWGQRGGMGKLGMASRCWRAELGGDLGKEFFWEVSPPQKSSKAQVLPWIFRIHGSDSRWEFIPWVLPQPVGRDSPRKGREESPGAHQIRNIRILRADP